MTPAHRSAAPRHRRDDQPVAALGDVRGMDERR
jgi:hypothetical protein